jgi:hypothetical protein
MKLKQLPYTGVNATYALLLESGKIKHYTVSFVHGMVTNQSPLEAITRMIKSELGEDVKLEVVPMDTYDITPTAFKAAEEAFLSLLDAKTLNNLEKVKTPNSLLYQYNKTVWWSGILKPLAFLTTSRVASSVDEMMRHFCIQKVFKVGHDDWDMTYNSRAHEILLNIYFSVRGFINTLSEKTTYRQVAPTRSLAIVCEEERLPDAIKQLASDLNKLNSHTKILGHSTKFHILTLANVIGNDGRTFAIVTMPIVELTKKQHKLMRDTDLIKLMRDEYGVTSLVREGGITYLDGKSPYSDLLLSSETLKAPDVGFIDDSILTKPFHISEESHDDDDRQ